MKRNLRILVAALALCVGVTGVAAAQDDGDHRDQRSDRDHDGDRRDRDHHDRYRQNGYYGGRDHDRDRDRDDRYRNDGYYGRRGDGDRDDGYRDNGYYGNRGDGHSRYGYGRGDYANPGYRMGYNDGLMDGQRDFRTGHSFRPAQDDNFKHADRGYNSSFGAKSDYRQQYRQAYEEGYRSGYGQ